MLNFFQSIGPLGGDRVKGDPLAGPGGQNVNKVATAVHLFFDIQASSLPEIYKQKLLNKKTDASAREEW